MSAPTRLRPVLPAVGVALALVLTGCGDQTADPSPGLTATPPPDSPVSSEPSGGGPDPDAGPTIALPPDAPLPASKPFESRARQVASEWDARGLTTAWAKRIVALEPLTKEPDSGYPTSSAKEAFAGGWVRASGRLPSPTKPTATVEVGGTTSTYDLVDATRALEQAAPRQGAPCPVPDGASSGCAWLEVTSARLTTTTLLTNRGEATVPAWEFSLESVTAPLVQVAVDPDDLAAGTFTDPLGGQGGKYPGVVASQGLISVDGSTVTYDVGIGDCDTDVVPRVLETEDLVLVGATVTVATGVCNDMLKIQPVQVTTRQPVGTRAVVDALTGVPLVPSATPR